MMITNDFGRNDDQVEDERRGQMRVIYSSTYISCANCMIDCIDDCNVFMEVDRTKTWNEHGLKTCSNKEVETNSENWRGVERK